MSNKNRVFILGLDGASFRVLDPLMEQGHMPNLKKIVKSGVRSILKSTYPPITPAAWVSFMTGKNPGKHGVYGWLQQIKGEYNNKPIDIKRFYKDTLWSYLSELGKKVGVINVPITYPPQKVNGFIVSGMDTPSENNCTYPPLLYRELTREIGEYVIEIKWNEYMNKSKTEFLDDLFYCTKKRLGATLFLMDRFEWDFFISVFVGMDRIQHFLWREVEHVLNGVIKDGLTKEVLRFYKYIDEIMGKINDHLDNDTMLIIMSDHGFKPCSKIVHWNRWLLENGYLFLNENKKRFLDNIIPSLHRLGISRKNIRLILESVGINNKKIVNKLSIYSRDYGVVDWKATKAFSLYSSGIRINLKGREPNGIVEPEEYEALISDISQKMKELRDPDNGRHVLKEVYRANEIYKGHYLELAPDIIIDYGKNPYDSIVSGKLDAPAVLSLATDERRGNHEIDGVFIGYGNAFVKSVDVGFMDIVDIFPTTLYIMGLPVPYDVDGKIVDEIFIGSFKEKSKAEKVFLRRSKDDVKNIEDRSPEEDKIIEERLRGLGYID